MMVYGKRTRENIHEILHIQPDAMTAEYFVGNLDFMWETFFFFLHILEKHVSILFGVATDDIEI